MAYTLKDLNGEHHSVETEIKLIEEENGPAYIEMQINPTPHNKKFIRNITENWKIYGVLDEIFGYFVINYVEKVGAGLYPALKIKAEAAVIHKLKTTIINGYYTGSRTFGSYFSTISNHSGVSIYPMTDRPAFGWDKFGLGAQAITEFTRGVNNYGVTYVIKSENIIELHDKIGREAPYVIKNAMNSDGFHLEIDNSNEKTIISGYANYTEQDGDNFYTAAKLKKTYRSPKADLIGEKFHEDYSNMNIKDEDLLMQRLKEKIEASIVITLKTKFYRLKEYPFAVPKIGDNVTVQDESIDLNTKARIVKLVTYFDAYQNIYDYDIEFGNLDIGKRNRVTAEGVSRTVNDIQEGRTPIRLSAFDEYAALAIKDMKRAQTEVIIGSSENGQDGILLLEKNDHSRGVWLNSRGIVLSKDAFQTAEVAINADGINATTIRTGTMMADRIMGGILRDFWGNFEWNLNTGEFFIGSSKLVYKNYGNALVYGALGNACGVTFSKEKDSDYPVVVVGTSPNIGTDRSPTLDSNSTAFTGVRAFNNGISGNKLELIGDHINFRSVSGDNMGYSLSLRFKSGVASLTRSSEQKFTIGEKPYKINGLYSLKLNDMLIGDTELWSPDGKHGIAFTDGDFRLIYDNKAYSVKDIINNANFSA